MKWVALFSQSGSEIVEIAEHLKRTPDYILTNNLDVLSYNPKIRVHTACRHDSLMEYLRHQTDFSSDADDTLITLHGYLRIIPADICERYHIINGHPGLISVYPELKGKDPQVRAWNGTYDIIGSVVHEVTPIVDDGKILTTAYVPNTCTSLDEMYTTLKDMSLQAWIHYLEGNL